MTQSFGLEALIELIEKLKGREDYYGSEETTRAVIIDPIFEKLGYNVGVGGQEMTDPGEFVREHNIYKGKKKAKTTAMAKSRRQSGLLYTDANSAIRDDSRP